MEVDSPLTLLLGVGQEESLPTTPGVLPDDLISEAGRKVLRFQLVRMLQHEPGTRAGEDIEELHDMRVATRRMRAAFQVFGDYFDSETITPYLRGLRRTARALGAVRDLDVFMEKAKAYLASLPPEENTSLDPLLSSWQTQREEARQRMSAYLDSKRYRKFCRRFACFLSKEGAGALPLGSAERPSPARVRHLAPALIYERWAQVRAFEPYLADAPVETLHALRIHCKFLRYTLEFFQEVLESEARDVIREVVAIQDHLGDLQDAAVAADLLRDFVNEWAERQRAEPALQRVDIHGVARYLAAKQSELHELLQTFPRAWERLSAPEFRRKLALAVASL